MSLRPLLQALLPKALRAGPALPHALGGALEAALMAAKALLLCGKGGEKGPGSLLRGPGAAELGLPGVAAPPPKMSTLAPADTDKLPLSLHFTSDSFHIVWHCSGCFTLQLVWFDGTSLCSTQVLCFSLVEATKPKTACTHELLAVKHRQCHLLYPQPRGWLFAKCIAAGKLVLHDCH